MFAAYNSLDSQAWPSSERQDPDPHGPPIQMPPSMAPEIMVEILWHALAGRDYVAQDRDRRSWSQVDKHWREVVKQSPRLWEEVVVNPNIAESLTDISRGAPHPLALTVSLPAVSSTFRWTTILASASLIRLYSLTVLLGRDAAGPTWIGLARIEGIKKIHMATSSPQCITVVSLGATTLSVSRAVDLFVCAPYLHTVTLDRVRMPTVNWLLVLEAMPLLESLRLTSCQMDGGVTQALTLPHLVHLHLSLDGAGGRMSCPMLLSTSMPNLGRLELASFNPQNVRTATQLLVMPSLTHLVFRGSLAGRVVNSPLIPYLPMLKQIHVHGAGFLHFFPASLAETFQSLNLHICSADFSEEDVEEDLRALAEMPEREEELTVSVHIPSWSGFRDTTRDLRAYMNDRGIVVHIDINIIFNDEELHEPTDIRGFFDYVQALANSARGACKRGRTQRPRPPPYRTSTPPQENKGHATTRPPTTTLPDAADERSITLKADTPASSPS
ncbi:hypothetical protein C8R46DRAFT_1211236 [Mycena filopes]|nr:hypothetical protein C8R46DRAFT_1211236 [Mycena filopes]